MHAGNAGEAVKYDNIKEAVFIDRPNRFIANVLIDGKSCVCHVKNTGRCRELLTPGARVLVQAQSSPARKTAFDLISVWKGERLINMDAAAPNAVFAEYLKNGGLGFVPELVRPELRHGDSRFDFYFEHEGKKAFAEVKGVTLEDEGIVRFPDAPTLRGIKHLHGLCQCVQEGFEAYVVFIIQMHGVRYFEPNSATHADFALALRQAQDSGVHIIALDCLVERDSIRANLPVDVQL